MHITFSQYRSIILSELEKFGKEYEEQGKHFPLDFPLTNSIDDWEWHFGTHIQNYQDAEKERIEEQEREKELKGCIEDWSFRYRSKINKGERTC